MLFFFFNDTATTEIYTLSLHDALPICRLEQQLVRPDDRGRALAGLGAVREQGDRKSTRLNSSHLVISYAVFCLKKKKKKKRQHTLTHSPDAHRFVHTAHYLSTTVRCHS